MLAGCIYIAGIQTWDICLMYRRIGGEKDAAVHLQEDPSSLQEWEKTWLMDFHTDKCEILKITNDVKPNNSD